MQRVFSLAIVFLTTTLASAQVVSEAEKKEGFKPLFNGKDFEGWKTNKEILKNWTIQDDMLKLSGRGPSIFTKDEYADFILRFEWRPHKAGYNSGLFIRGSTANQVQMMQSEAGQFFPNRKVGKGVPELHKKPGEWNEWELTCIGPKVTLKVNGKLAWEVNDFKSKKGYIGIESEGAAIDFKNMRIKVIEPQAGATAKEPPFSLKDYRPPTPNKKDEPLAKQFSLEKAARFLDSSTLHWQTTQKCFTCHTNHPYLYARPLISADDPAPREIRQALEDYVAKSFDKGRRLQGFYAVSAATSLAINDSITTKKLHPLTKKALDHMWTVQGKDGKMPWGGGGDPVGSAHFGAMIAAIAVSVAPEGYAQTEAAQKGLALIRSWLADHPPKMLYDKAMVLWASGHVDGLLTPEEKANIIAELRGKQLEDGGWSLPSLGNGQRRKGQEQDPTISDGYATALCIYALRQAGVSAQDCALTRGIAWLKSNQRESGRWFTRGVLTNIGSDFAVMAIQSCAERAP